MKTNPKLIGSLLIGASFGLVVLWLFIKTGYEVSLGGANISARDPQGNELASGLPITRELLKIIIGNASAKEVIARLPLSVIVCLTGHLAGLWVLWSPKVGSRAKKRFFLVQMPLFASGFLGVVLWMSSLITRSPVDGKSIGEDPWQASAFASWVVASAIIAFMAWRAERKAFRWPDFAAQQRAIFGDHMLPAGTIRQLMDEERGER